SMTLSWATIRFLTDFTPFLSPIYHNLTKYLYHKYPSLQLCHFSRRLPFPNAQTILSQHIELNNLKTKKCEEDFTKSIKESNIFIRLFFENFLRNKEWRYRYSKQFGLSYDII